MAGRYHGTTQPSPRSQTCREPISGGAAALSLAREGLLSGTRSRPLIRIAYIATRLRSLTSRFAYFDSLGLQQGGQA
ncbi:hypothetical protein SAMN05444724_0382 [Salinivibrio sp. ES.052]|nr:hypothetical protein SAMN05444724_0382 [Salinivibrio sp. ES.052]